MQNSVTVRAAQAQDKDAILAFCQNTFSWGDYIVYVWDEWLVSPRGKMFVGVVSDQPVGIMRVAFLNDGAAWMEGMRVHPDFRRLGVASAMDAAGRDYARTRGCTLARLATAQSNLAAQKTLATQGYKCIAQYGEWRAPAARGKFFLPSIDDKSQDIFPLWRNAPNAIVADADWHWEKLDVDALHKIQRAGEIRIAPRGFAILRAMLDMDGSGLMLNALVGDANAMLALARSARAEANYRGYTRVDAMIADEPRVNHALERAGFQRDGGMFIYEQRL